MECLQDGWVGLTNDGNGLPGKAQPAPDAHVLAAAACRPEADHILCPKEHHQDDLLRKTAVSLYQRLPPLRLDLLCQATMPGTSAEGYPRLAGAGVHL